MYTCVSFERFYVLVANPSVYIHQQSVRGVLLVTHAHINCHMVDCSNHQPIIGRFQSLKELKDLASPQANSWICLNKTHTGYIAMYLHHVQFMKGSEP